MIPEDERLDLMLLSEAVRYQRWALSSFGSAPRGRVLEVGAGVGNFTRWLARTADLVVVAEPDASMASALAAAARDNVEVRAVPIEGLRGSGERFDAVVAINVLEHVEDDREAVRIAFELLDPGGRLCVFVPAHQALFGSLDRRYGHLRRYTRRETRALLEAVGFHVSRCRYFNPVGALGWWAVGRLARRKRLSRGSVWLSERIAVPVGRALERIGDPAFGQSVVAVGVRPSGPRAGG